MSDRKLTLKGMVIDFTVHHLADDNYNIIIHEMTDKGYVKLLTLELDHFPHITNLLTIGDKPKKKLKLQ